ncbi:MAG: hypothetical protein Q8O83_03890 [bacterium]|nr:hypothetical protein [bacterium]
MYHWTGHYVIGNIDSDDEKDHIRRPRKKISFATDTVEEAVTKTLNILKNSARRWKKSNSILGFSLFNHVDKLFFLKDNKNADRDFILNAKTPEECFREYGLD